MYFWNCIKKGVMIGEYIGLSYSNLTENKRRTELWMNF